MIRAGMVVIGSITLRQTCSHMGADVGLFISEPACRAWIDLSLGLSDSLRFAFCSIS